MNKIFVFIFQFIITSSFAQENYTEYYLKINLADKHYVEEDYERSFALYYHAFELNFPFIHDLNRFIDLSNKVIMDSDKEIKLNNVLLLKEVFFTSNLSNFLNHLIIRAQKSDSIKNVLIKNFCYIKNDDFLLPKNEIIELVSLINNMFYADQIIRRLQLSDSECKDSVLKITDIKNRNRLTKLLSEIGFPNRKNLGNQNLHFLLLHVSLYMDLNAIEELLLPQVVNGNYHPLQYARLIDRHLSWTLNEPQIYGEWVGSDRKIENIFDIENVDRRREKIFLNSLLIHSKLNNLTLPKDYPN